MHHRRRVVFFCPVVLVITLVVLVWGLAGCPGDPADRDTNQVTDAGTDVGPDAQPSPECEVDDDCEGKQLCWHNDCRDACDGDDDCPADHHCHEDRCVPTDCSGIDCEPDQTCYRGVCYPTCDENADCADDEACFEDACVDACEPVDCPEDQACYRGVCYEACTVSEDCSADHKDCFDGACIDGPCQDVDCADDQTCYRGVCYPSCGDETDCTQPDERCWNDHHCAPTGCEDVVCSDEETCVAGICHPGCDEDDDCSGNDEVCWEQTACLEPDCEEGRPAGEISCPDLLGTDVDVTDITDGKATFIGRFTIVPLTVLDHGFCWDTAGQPGADDDNCTSLDVPSAEGPFSLEVGTLQPDTEYFVQSYATTSAQTHYSDPASFTTPVGPPDEDQSSITADKDPVADGIDEAEITIELRDWAGNALTDVVPTIAVGDDDMDCPATDASGESTCRVSSTDAETRSLEITEPIEIEGDDIEFVECTDDPSSLAASHPAYDLLGGGDGTDAQPYRGCTPDQLKVIGESTDLLDETFRLETNIEMPVGADPDMIGDNDDPFEGAFRGNNHRIEDLTIQRDSTDDVGLFGVVGSSGVIEDLEIQGATITGDSNVGGLAGRNLGTVSGSTVSASESDITGSYRVGGLIGYNETGGAEVFESTAAVPVTGEHRVGGLIGQNTGTVEDSSVDDLDVSAVGNRVGGLIGDNQDSDLVSIDLSSSSNGEQPDVEGNNAVGGLVGRHENGELRDLQIDLRVQGDDNVGGLVGHTFGADTAITESSFDGEVSGTDYVGGLVGRNTVDEVSITESSFAGEVSGADYVGGIAGRNDGTIEASVASGTVDGVSRVGGMVGNNAGPLKNSYALGEVHGQGEQQYGNNVLRTGGLVGYNGLGTIEYSFAAAEVTSDRDWNDQGALVGWNDINGEIFDAYCDVEVTEQDGCIGRFGGTDDNVNELTTSEMQGDTPENQTMTELDWTDVWTTTTDYPRLQWE